jgi:hypothetical protein
LDVGPWSYKEKCLEERRNLFLHFPFFLTGHMEQIVLEGVTDSTSLGQEPNGSFGVGCQPFPVAIERTNKGEPCPRFLVQLESWK